MAAERGRWAALTLVDAATPVGGFAHSLGLEAAAAAGAVGVGAGSVRAFASQALLSFATLSLPFALAVHRAVTRDDDGEPAAEAWASADAALHAALAPSPVARRASLQQGAALVRLARGAFAGAGRLDPLLAAREASVRGASAELHHATAFAAVAAALGVSDAGELAGLLLYVVARDVCGASTRLGLLGPAEAAALQWELGAYAEELAGDAAGAPRGYGDAACAAPIPELLQQGQGALFTRLFTS